MSVAEVKTNQERRLESLGNLCHLIKGETATMKATPGQYPLVVTGATARSSSEYQLDREAVCIPLVSSTGHGHASIHRVHYQKGKFALANIMVALVPKNEAEVDAKYLHLLLTARKDELLVPLMAGTSNVSLRLPDLSAVRIEIPSIEEQIRVVASVEASLAKLTLARIHRDLVIADFERLTISLAHRDDLSNDQKCGLGWRRVRLGEVMRLDLDQVKVDPAKEYPNLGVFSFGKGAFGKQPLSGLEISAKVLYRVRAGQLVYLKLNGYEGAYAQVPGELDGFFVSNEFPTFTCDPNMARAEWLASYFKKPAVWARMAQDSRGTPTRRQRVNPGSILAHEVWLPSLGEQNRIANVLATYQHYVRQDSFEKDAEALRRSILSRAFRGNL